MHREQPGVEVAAGRQNHGRPAERQAGHGEQHQCLGIEAGDRPQILSPAERRQPAKAAEAAAEIGRDAKEQGGGDQGAAQRLGAAAAARELAGKTADHGEDESREGRRGGDHDRLRGRQITGCGTGHQHGGRDRQPGAPRTRP